MAELFSITRTEGEVLMLHLAGRLDVQTQAALLETAMQAREAGKRYLLVDLRQVEVITSAGLGALHQVFKMFTPPEDINAWEAEGHNEPYKSPYFKMAGASSDVYYVLNIAGFLQNIPIYPDIGGALASFLGLAD